MTASTPRGLSRRGHALVRLIHTIVTAVPDALRASGMMDP
jgi:hypothetical protein